MPKINFPRLAGVLLSAALVFTTVMAYTSQEVSNISSSVLRLHIIANSDGEADQQLKLRVRDEIISSCSDLFENCQNAEQSQKIAADNIEYITEVANQVISENGFDYSASCSVEQCRFPTKQYKNEYDGVISLPRGMYTALNIRLGRSEGQNWWCVMYPPLCFVDGVATVNQESSNLLRSELGDAEYELITESDSPGVQIKFKLAEVLGSL